MNQTTDDYSFGYFHDVANNKRGLSGGVVFSEESKTGGGTSFHTWPSEQNSQGLHKLDRSLRAPSIPSAEELVEYDYEDHFMDAISEKGESFFQTLEEDFPLKDEHTCDEKKTYRFPCQLHKVLDDESLSSIVCWRPHGRACIILDRDAFIHQVMPK